MPKVPPLDVYERAFETLTRYERGVLRERWFGSDQGLLYFAWEAVKTKDEHDGTLKALPREFYLLDHFKNFLREPLYFILKSRQIMITWATFIACVWETLRYRYCSIALVPKKDEDGEAHIEDRVRNTIWPSLPQWVRDDFDFALTKGRFTLKDRALNSWPRYLERPPDDGSGGGDWSSWIMSVARGEDQLRQHTLRRIFWDEMAFQDLARRSWQAAMPTIGSRGGKGGRVIAVSTMLPGSFHDHLMGVTDKGDSTLVDAAVAIAMGERAPSEMLTSPGVGICHYRNNKRGAFCAVYSFLADSEKRTVQWEQQEARRLFGGVDTPEWQLDYRMRRDAFRGVLAFPHFNPAWNVVPERDVDLECEIFLSFDFGHTNPTAIIFWEWSEHKQTLTCFGELYMSATEAGVMKQLIEQELSKHLRLALDETVFEEVLGDNVGDPAGASYMLSYVQRPHPLAIRGNPPSESGSSWKINTPVTAGEARLDSAFRPSFVHCGVRQYPPDGEMSGVCHGTVADESSGARACGQQLAAKPVLTIMEGRAPNLMQEIPLQKRSDPGDPSLEASEKSNKNVPNHATDSARYAVMRYPHFLDIEPEAASQPRYMTRPMHKLTTQERFWREKHVLGQEAQARTLAFEETGEIAYPDGDFGDDDDADPD